MLLTIAVEKGLDLVQLDVHTAFLIPELPKKEQIYMRVPPNSLKILQSCGLKIEDGQSLLLKKCIYGLRQASKYWNNELVNILVTKLGFTQVPSEPCLFKKKTKVGPVFIIIWVDDLLIAGKRTALSVVVGTLKRLLPMKDLGFPSIFTGVRIRKIEGGLFLDQALFTQQALRSFNMQDAKSQDTPASSLRLQAEGSIPLEENVPYRSAVGSLLWLALNTRPDIAFAVSQVAKFSHAPTQAHWTAVKKIFRYLNGTVDLGIPITKMVDEMTLTGYSDADWAGEPEKRRSTGGFLFKLGSTPISWKCVVHKSICLSSVESEIIFLSKACQEVKWLARICNEFNLKISLPVIYCDNQGALALAKNDGVSQRTKHIEIRDLFAKEAVKTGLVDVKYLKTEDMPADIFTKPLAKVKFLHLRPLLGLKYSEAQ